ncbi:hypothetical protein H4Q26_003914 [Puccinia striiformis f. sp. tritici PST-130]|nr:hypothetical protein H4Q26_003914 [Puccinia striiformis f. sp. tritici PST-130]
MPPTRNLSGPQEWMKPSKKHGPRWEGFLMSDLRNNVSRRRRAKCTHCQKIFNQAKPQLLFSHIKDVCPNISAEQKSSYLSNSMKSNESTHSISSDEDDGRKISVTIEPSNSKPNQSVKQYFQPFSHEKTLKLHELLVKSLISSNLLFSFFENPYFQEYQLELA